MGRPEPHQLVLWPPSPALAPPYPRRLFTHACTGRPPLLQGLRQLARCSSLEALDLSYVPGITPEGLKALAAGLPALASLRLVDCPRATTVLGMRALTGAKALTVLDASDNRRLDDGAMQVGGGRGRQVKPGGEALLGGRVREHTADSRAAERLEGDG